MGDGRDIDSAGEEGSKWRFLIDENLSPDIAEELDVSGIEARYVLDALFEGADDFDDILPYCQETETVLVTNNILDFNRTDLAPQDHAGIVIVHNKTRPPSEIAEEIRAIVEAYPSQDALNGFESADDWSSDKN